MKKIKSIILVLVLGLLLVLASCKTKEVKAESIDVYTKLVEYDLDYKLQFYYYVFPSNANNVDIEWTVDSTDATIDENGLFSTNAIDKTFVVTCIDKVSNISTEYTVNTNRSYNYKALWINNRSFNYINNLDDSNLKKFVDKYNNSFIYSYDVINLINEKEKDNPEFLEVINELEKTYFNESNLENKMYVLCKLTYEEYDLLPMLDVNNIEINEEGLTLSLKENSKSDNTFNELYYLLEIDKDNYKDFFDLNLDNKNVFYIDLKIKFMNED